MNVFIGLSASENIEKHYYSLAKEVANSLADLKYNLLCGSTNVGMAKIVSDIFKEKSTVKLFIKEKYKESIVDGYCPYEICKTSFDRCKHIYNKANLYVILPGGIGTLSELFGIIEECRGLSVKKIIIFNYNLYYDEIIFFIQKMIKAKFLDKVDISNLIIVSNIEEFKKEVNKKWMRKQKWKN